MSTMGAARLPRRSSMFASSVSPMSTSGRPTETMTAGQNHGWLVISLTASLRFVMRTSDASALGHRHVRLNAPHPLRAALGRDLARGLDDDRVGDAVGHALRDVDAGLVVVALHAVREVHGIPPHVVDDPRAPDQSARDLPGVEARPQAQLDTLLHRIPLEDRVELEGELHRTAGVVDAGRAETDARDVRLARRSHALDAVPLGGLVEDADEVVELRHGLFGRQCEGELL